MKEKLYTIELTDAVHAGDECMFCWLERRLEQQNLEFVLGSSYMESDVREQTDRQGFCRRHTKMMFQYGNTLGNAWILKSRMEYVNSGLKKQLETMRPAGSGGFQAGGLLGQLKRMGKNAGGGASPEGTVPAAAWIRQQEGHCYICERMEEIYRRMLDTFVYLMKNDEAFREALSGSDGFCLPHFADVLDVSEQEWIPLLADLMAKNLDRMQEDVNWLIEKYDYRNKDADWKQSKDAVQRAMQKLAGGHPADPPFACKK